jgi:predicted small lipoprotein YifL
MAAWMREWGVASGSRSAIFTATQEHHVVQPRLTHVAVIGLLAAAFALAGCGRKGALDPPPTAGAPPPPAKATMPGIGLHSAPAPAKPKTTTGGFDEEGRPIASGNAPKRRLPMDWLIE